jgi:hypothetical protein
LRLETNEAIVAIHHVVYDMPILLMKSTTETPGPSSVQQSNAAEFGFSLYLKPEIEPVSSSVSG